MPNPKPTTLTPEIVAAHERLYPRLAALLKQIERVAGRRAAPVPAETVALAKSLCDEARKLLGREGRGIVLGQSPDATGLALALGQAVAALETFEAEHSGHSEKLGYAIWALEGPAMPVTRHLPKGHGGKPVEAKDPMDGHYRRELTKLIMLRFKYGYDAGYRDAKAGKPPSADNAERIWDDLMEKEAGVDEARSAGRPTPRVRLSNPPRDLVPEGAELSDPKERRRNW